MMSMTVAPNRRVSSCSHPGNGSMTSVSSCSSTTSPPAATTFERSSAARIALQSRSAYGGSTKTNEYGVAARCTIERSTSDRMTVTLSVQPRVCAFERANRQTAVSWSTSVAAVAPRLIDSNARMPLPQHRSRTVEPDRSMRCPSIANNDSRARSVVGRVDTPSGAATMRPLKCPPVIRIRHAGRGRSVWVGTDRRPVR